MPNINFLGIIKKYSIANRGRFNNSDNPILKANTFSPNFRVSISTNTIERNNKATQLRPLSVN